MMDLSHFLLCCLKEENQEQRNKRKGSGWIKTDTEDIMPPGFKDHQKGRKQEKRRKGKFEVPKPKENSRMATITCSNCKLQGHKYTSCSVPFRPDLAIRKNNHKVKTTISYVILLIGLVY